MSYLNDIREFVGNTPMLKLNNLNIKTGVNVFAKLELFNPGGSIKDRIGIHMIERAERDGSLKSGYTIIEATAGNTGIGIALAAINKGYKIIFVVPGKFSLEKQILMRALGAEVINTEEELGIEGAVQKSKELLGEIKNSISLKQFENAANPETHYVTTGPEIYRDLNGQIDYFVAGAGSGGTFSGIAKYLKEKNPNIKAVIADPVGSTLGGGVEGCYKIEGIGNNFMPATLDSTLADGFIKVTDEEAFYEVKRLALKEGIIAGSSSGAALAAAIKLSETIESGNIVVVFPDRGDRYFTKNLYYNFTE